MIIKNYRLFEPEFGTMFHLLIDKQTEEGIKFVSDHNYPKFASIDSNPIYFDDHKNFRIATDFTIIYPKVYVRDSIPLIQNHLPITRCWLQ